MKMGKRWVGKVVGEGWPRSGHPLHTTSGERSEQFSGRAAGAPCGVAIIGVQEVSVGMRKVNRREKERSRARFRC
jgi:hypothetical protein